MPKREKWSYLKKRFYTRLVCSTIMSLAINNATLLMLLITNFSALYFKLPTDIYSTHDITIIKIECMLLSIITAIKITSNVLNHLEGIIEEHTRSIDTFLDHNKLY